MNVSVAGTFRVSPDKLEAIKPHFLKLVESTRGEDGCIVYSMAVDVVEPNLIRVFEIWRDQAALDAHFETQHIKEWRAIATAPENGFNIHDRALNHYDIGEPHN